jgi:hypothetical protein
MVCGAGGAAHQMQHIGWAWKTRAVALVAIAVGTLPVVAHAEADSTMRVERTSSFDVALTIGPVQPMLTTNSMQAQPSTDMGMSNNAMPMGGTESPMQPAQADQGMAVNHWLDVHVTQAGSGAVVSGVTPTIRITDKSNGEAREIPAVMGMAGGMDANDLHYGQNVFLPDGTYQISVLLGPSDTAQFRDVVVASNSMMAEPSMNDAMGQGHDMTMTDQPGMHP